MQEFTPVLWSAPFDFTTSGLLQFPVFLPKYLLSSSFYRSTMAAKEGDPPDFSEAWLFSDVVFVVEDKKFHVHRYVLAQWSPVFETMFSSEFKEKNFARFLFQTKRRVSSRNFCYSYIPLYLVKLWIPSTTRIVTLCSGSLRSIKWTLFIRSARNSWSARYKMRQEIPLWQTWYLHRLITLRNFWKSVSIKLFQIFHSIMISKAMNCLIKLSQIILNKSRKESYLDTRKLQLDVITAVAQLTLAVRRREVCNGGRCC